MKDILKHARDFLRSIRNGHYEYGDKELILPDQKIAFSGLAGMRNITAGEDWVDSKNMVMKQGINYLLTTALNSGAAKANWYFAPYVTNSAPVNTTTAATFVAAMDEFTSYDGSDRALCNFDDATERVITSAANAVSITINIDGETQCAGLGIISSLGKSSGGGSDILLAIAPLSAVRTGMQAGDEYGLRYTLTGSST